MLSDTTPKRFWPLLFLDALPLLEGDVVVFNSDQTSDIMRCVEEVFLSKRLSAAIPADYLEVLRLALVRNLARAVLLEKPSLTFGNS